MKSAPHYLLLTDTDQFNDETCATPPAGHSIAPTGGRWHFVLEPIHHGVRIEADDIEPGIFGERLNLLAVVRGIEALDQPSHVTLVTPSKYVGRGIRRDIRVWKENKWHWDRFGERVKVKHYDLWQRIDRAMKFHKIDCRIFGAGSRRRLQRATEQLKDLSLVHDHESPYQLRHQIDHQIGHQIGPYAAPFASELSHDQKDVPHPSKRHHGKAGFMDWSPALTSTRVKTLKNTTSMPNNSHRRRIVLTNERMNDAYLALDDVEALETRHQKLFKATKTGWTRVTEIDADTPLDQDLTAAFGCSAN